MYNLKLTVVLVFVLAGICSSFLYGQTRMGTRDLNRVGDQYFDMDQFSRATSFYEQSLKINNKDGHANYHLGECYRNLFDYGTAEVYYKRTSQLEPKKYPLSLYYFALMQKLNGKFDQAMLGFDVFLEFVKTYPQNKTLAKNTHLKEQAHIDKEGCILALNQLSHPYKDFKFQRMPEPINSESMDYAASVYETEDMIAFTSGRAAAKGKSFNQRLGESFSDIFLYEKVDNVWQPVKRKDENFKIINSKWGDGSGTFNHDKTKYYYTNCHQDLGSSCHIYLSTKVDGKWSQPVALNSNINLSSHSSKQPTLSQGGDTLFFSSNRPGGIGMEDIWMSISSGNDGWGPPINMGPQVNTKLKEITPFFSEKDETLFFASNGHRGFGGFDIFMAKGRSFMDPEIYNMGYPFNSNKDEMYLYLGRTIGFVTSNRKGGSGKFDIYSFEIETEEAVIAEVDNEESIAGRNSIFSDDFEFDNDDRVQIEKIISLVVASHLYGVDLAFTDTELAFYESLTQDDKDRIERIVNSKIRNFSDSDLTAMRDEDAFYYDNLSDQDRAHINSIIDSYMEDRGLTASVTLNAEDRSFYNRLSLQDQEKVNRMIARGMQQGDLSIYYGESANGRQYFDGLSSSDQERIDRLAAAFLKGKADFPNSVLNSADRSYYESLSTSQKQSVDAAIQNRIRNLGQTGPFALNQEDLDFYQSLNPEQRAGFDQLATAYMLAELNTLSENLGTDDLSLYQELSSIRQEAYDKILAKKIKNLGDADQYRFSILTDDERVRIDRMVDALNLVGSFTELPGQLTGSDRLYYNQLIPNEKSRLHRMIKARSKAGEVVPIATSKPVVAQSKTDDNSGDLSNYKFDSQELTKIEEVISKMVISRLYGVELAFTDVQLNFYQNLSSNDKETMERIVNSRVRNLTDSDLTALRDEDEFYYNSLSESDKQHINNMVDSYYQVRELGSSVVLADEVNVFYQNLTLQNKDKVNRLVADRIQEMERADYLGESPLDKEFYESLSANEKQYIDQLTLAYLGNKSDFYKVSLNSPAGVYYQNLTPAKRGQINNVIKNELLKLSQIEGLKLTESDRSYYQQLNPPQKQILNRIAQAFTVSDLNNFEESVQAADLDYYNSLSDSDKKIADKILAIKMKNFSGSDQYYFNNLNQEDQLKIDRLAQAYLKAGGLSNLGSFLSPQDQGFYSSFNGKEKDRIQRLAAARSQNLGATIPELQVTDLQFDSRETIKIQRMVSLMVAARLYGVEMAFTEADLNFYKSLSQPDKDRIDRIVNSRIRNLSDSDLTVLRDEDEFYYNDLSDGDRDHVNGIIDNYLEERNLTQSVVLNDDDAVFYRGLGRENKAHVDRLVAYHVSQVDDDNYFGESYQDRQFVDGLSSQQRGAIDDMAKSLLTDKSDFDPSTLTGPEQEFYQSLSPAEQKLAQNAIKNRLRGVSRSDAFQIAPRDRQYYQNLTAVQKQIIDRMASVFLISEVDGVSQNFRSSDLAFYNGLSNSDKAMVDRILATKIANHASADQYYYTSLTEIERNQIDRLANVYLKEGSTTSMAQNLETSDQEFYSQLNEKEKTRLNRLAAAKSKNLVSPKITLSAQEKTQAVSIMSNSLVKMNSRDAAYYQNLSTDDKRIINNIAGYYYKEKKARMLRNLGPEEKAFYENLMTTERTGVKRLVCSPFTAVTEQDRTYFNGLTGQEKLHIVKMAAALAMTSNELSKTKLGEQEQQYFNNLTASQKATMENIIAAPFLNLSEKDLAYYNRLSEPEQARINRIAVALILSQGDLAKAVLSREDRDYYQRLSGGKKRAIDNILASSLSADPDAVLAFNTQRGIALAVASSTGFAKTDEVIQADVDYYQNLSREERNRLDRIVAQTIISEDYLENPDLREQDQNYLSTLDKTERDRINRLARIFNTLYKDDPKVYMLNQDLSYYQHMAPEKRARINRLIGQKALGKQSTFELDPGDKRYLRNLNNKETARVFRLIAIRKASRKLFGEDLELDYQALQQSDVMAKVNTFNSQQYGNVTITGKLIHLISGLPASEIEIPLMNEKGEVVKITTTSRDGSFRYSNLPANQHFRVVAESGIKKLTDVDKYFIKDLNITGSQKIAGKIKYENIYFNFNSAILRDEAKIVLGELVVLAKNNPEMQVEMNAFTDYIGSDEYNLDLSKNRGKAVFDYLVNSGMPRTSLVMNARGKASPAASNLNRYGRQLNRRVEFEIFGKDVDFESSYTTYIVRPKTTLYSLARSFDMTVDELIKINGLTTNTISAYSPIRVNKTDKVDYGLVFQGSASPKGYQQYSVREGETIYSVAERFQIPEELLMEINGLRNPNLKPGQLLNIYIQ